MTTHGSDVARTITSAGEIATGAVRQVAEGTRAVLAHGDRPVASGVDRGRHRDAGNQQDPAHRHGGAVRAAARRQHPAAGSAHRRARQPELAGARAGDPRGRLRLRHERRHLAQRRRHPDAGRPATVFNSKTTRALEDLGSLSSQFETHGRALAEAAAVVEQSNRSTTTSVADRKALLESLVTTIDLRTTDLDQRLSRFTSLLDESLAAAEERARDIARVVAETAGAGSAAISRQFEAVRAAAEEERRLTSDAMNEIYQQGTQEADAMFRQSADKFSAMVASMKQMAAEMHNELEATRNELRRGVLEMPQEAAESTAQMRKVIVDQIEALAELNRIVARHGRGLDVVTAGRASVAARGRADAGDCRRTRRGASRSAPPRGSASTLPPPDLGMPAARRTEAPPVSPASSDQGRDGWLSDLLNRADAGSGGQAPRGRAPPAGSRRWQPAGVAVARHRPPDGSQSRRRDVGSLSARREQGVLPSGSTRRPARKRLTRSPANTAPTATSSRRSTATSPSSSGCSTRSRATNAAPRRCAATSPRRPASSTPCSRMRRDGWGKAQADYRIKNGGSDASVFVLAECSIIA